MPLKFNTIGLVVRKDIRAHLEAVRQVTRVLGTYADVLVHCLDTDVPGNDIPSVPLAQLVAQADLMISLGGDGTLLSVARALVNTNTPLLGINLGRLGFLADVSIDDFEAHLSAVVKGEYTVEKRFFIEGSISSPGQPDTSTIALNDIILHSHESLSMIEYEVYSDGDLIHKQRADGVIVTTPTGSTAYALSGGGPIMHPSVETLAIVPICPHTLSNRPIILPANQQIEICLSQAESSARVNFDGQGTRILNHKDRICIKRYAQPLTLLHPQDYDYFQILRVKLNWSANH